MVTARTVSCCSTSRRERFFAVASVRDVRPSFGMQILYSITISTYMFWLKINLKSYRTAVNNIFGVWSGNPINIIVLIFWPDELDSYFDRLVFPDQKKGSWREVRGWLGNHSRNLLYYYIKETTSVLIFGENILLLAKTLRTVVYYETEDRGFCWNI